MTKEMLAEFRALIGKFETAMLVTMSRSKELRSRPMAIAGCDEACHLWFITSIDSGKLDELTEFPFANVALQDGGRYVSLSGTVRATRDPVRIQQFWSETNRVWFEQGRDDPELILLELVPTFGEYWDRAGAEALRYTLAKAKAIITGETLSDDVAAHAKRNFNEPV